jgi:hypothetical protein
MIKQCLQEQCFVTTSKAVEINATENSTQ